MFRWAHRLIVAGTLAAAFTCSAVAPAAFAATPTTGNAVEEAAALVKPSIVALQAKWTGYVVDDDGFVYNGGYPLDVAFGCTGFVVGSDGYLGTAAHCVSVTDDVRAAFIDAAAKAALANGEIANTFSLAEVTDYGTNHWRLEGKQPGSSPVVDVTASGFTDATGAHTDTPSPAQVVSVDPTDAGDVALLHTERTGLYALPLDTAATVDVGTPVVSIGFPALTATITADPTFKDGTISANTTTGGKPYMEISAALASGMSGGPTVNDDGEVVGVNSFGASASTEAFNYVSSAANLRRLMDQANVTSTVGVTSAAYRAGLQAYFAGDYDTAVTKLDAVVAQSPANTVAADYDARAKHQQELTAFPIPMWVIVTAGGVLLLVGIVVGVAVRRRRRAAAPAGIPAQADRNTAFDTAAFDTAAFNTAADTAWPHPVFGPGAPAPTFGAPRQGGSTAVLTPTQRPTTCRSCGSYAGPTAAFCSTCGSTLT